MDILQIILIAINKLISQLMAVMPKLIISLIIWYLGRYLLNFASKLLHGLDTKGTSLNKKAIETLVVLLNGAGSIILILVILDYLGIGTSVISAIAQGITFAIAIALGISFGKALEDDAKGFVESVRKLFLTKEKQDKPKKNKKKKS